MAKKPEERPPLDIEGVGDVIGSINGTVTWERETIVDTPDRYEITLRLLPFTCANTATASVTPRRLQKFSVKSGAACKYEVKNAITGRLLKEGQAVADEHGRIQIKDTPISNLGNCLAIWK